MDEIGLKGIIGVLLKNKRIIAVITVISILLSAVINIFVLEPIYEAKTILIASEGS